MSATIEQVEPKVGAALVDGGAILLDVRQPAEWAAGHAPPAENLPLDELPARSTELPTDRRIVVICRSGGRSNVAAEALVAAGYDAVNLAGGMRAWIDEGLPCVTDTGAPGTVD